MTNRKGFRFNNKYGLVTTSCLKTKYTIVDDYQDASWFRERNKHELCKYKEKDREKR